MTGCLAQRAHWPRIALRRNISECPVRAHQTAIRALEEKTWIARRNNQRMLVRMNPIRRVRSRIAASTSRCRVGARVPSLIVEVLAGIVRVEDRLAIGAESVEAVLERAAQVNDIGLTRWRHDEVI